jgi:hypothetical protein
MSVGDFNFTLNILLALRGYRSAQSPASCHSVGSITHAHSNRGPIGWASWRLEESNGHDYMWRNLPKETCPAVQCHKEADVNCHRLLFVYAYGLAAEQAIKSVRDRCVQAKLTSDHSINSKKPCKWKRC